MHDAGYGIHAEVDTGAVVAKIWNNIVYDGDVGIYMRGQALTPYVYNNTVFDIKDVKINIFQLLLDQDWSTINTYWKLPMKTFIESHTDLIYF